MAAVTSAPTAPESTASTHPYTCLACSLAFTTASLQRSHYSTDLHRYNSKRRVAGLVPVTAQVFDSKLQERRDVVTAVEPEEDLTEGDGKVRKCEACNKSFASEGAEKSHLQSKKHKDVVFKGATKVIGDTLMGKTLTPGAENAKKEADKPAAAQATSSAVDLDDEKALEALVELRISQAPAIPFTSCLFCISAFDTLPEKLDHMLRAHSFFIPDQEYLVDMEGMMDYLAEIIRVWNVCLHCGAGFGGKIEVENEAEQGMLAKKGLERVRKHMCDKSHCKLAWDTESQRMELSDYYDFRSSYPDFGKNNKAKGKKALGAEEGWEEIDEEMADGEFEDAEIVTDDRDDDSNSDSDSDESLDSAYDGRPKLRYGDSPFEIILPSGARVGHRSLKHIYKQNLVPYTIGGEATGEGNPNANLISRLALTAANANEVSRTTKSLEAAERLQLAARKGALYKAGLVPAKGGIGKHGRGGEVIQARNKGEAKEAGRHVKEHRDAKRAELFRTKVATTSGNQQKHFRDHLLQ